MIDKVQAGRGADAMQSSLDEAGQKIGAKAADLARKAADAKDDGVDLASAASDLASSALDQGRNLIGAARDQATGYADRRKDDAAKSVGDLAASLRSTGQSFEGRPHIQAFVDSAADGLEQLASNVRERSFADLYGEFESFARERPLAVGAVSAVAGFILARFIKSSGEEMARQDRDVVLRRTTIRTAPGRAET